MSNVGPLFKSHLLNEVGLKKAAAVGMAIDGALAGAVDIWGPDVDVRLQALAEQHLELAGFYAKKAVAVQVVNQIV